MREPSQRPSMFRVMGPQSQPIKNRTFHQGKSVGADRWERIHQKAMGIPWVLWPVLPVLPGISQIRRTLKPSFRPWMKWLKGGQGCPGMNIWSSEVNGFSGKKWKDCDRKENRHIYPYGSKHCLRRYITPQIIPQTLPKKVLGSIGIYIYYIAITKQTDVKVLPGWYRRCFPCTTSCMCPTFLSIWVYCRLSLLEHRLFPQDFIRKHSDLDSDYPWVTQFKVRIHPSFAIFIDRSQLLDPFGPIWPHLGVLFTSIYKIWVWINTY